MNSVGSNNLSLKYQRFKPLRCIDLGIRKFELVAKTKFIFIYLELQSIVVIKNNSLFTEVANYD